MQKYLQKITFALLVFVLLLFIYFLSGRGGVCPAYPVDRCSCSVRDKSWSDARHYYNNECISYTFILRQLP